MKIEAIIVYGESKAYVFDSPVPDRSDLTYEKYDNNLYVGKDSDALFYDTLVYVPDFGVKAFGGMNFNIHLSDGTKVSTNGKFWDGGMNRANIETGVHIRGIVAESRDCLKTNYCFRSAKIDARKLYAMVERFYQENPNYTPKGYWEYKGELENEQCA